jgi:CelD/BcsL family acetyltransferase involved in cellulose biosynthesis
VSPAAPCRAGRLSARLVKSFAELEGLREEWSRLCDGCCVVTPFQRPEWLIPWWRHLGRGELHTVCIRRSGRLVALAPMFREGELLRLLGTGVSDYLDFVVEDGAAEEAASALCAAFEADGAWKGCLFEDLRSESAALRLPAPTGVADQVRIGVSCLVLPLRADGQGKVAFPKKARRNIRLYLNRARRRGAISFEAVADAAALEDVFSLDATRWQSRGHVGVLTDEAVREFHRDAAACLQARNGLLTLRLRVGGHLVAFLYGMRDHRTAYWYLAGFDPEAAEMSPGTLLMARGAELALEGGLAEVDMLRGDEGYKQHWGAHLHSNRSRTWSRRGDAQVRHPVVGSPGELDVS